MRFSIRFVILSAAIVAILSVFCTAKRYTIEQFERLVKGKTLQQVEDAIGKPKRIVQRHREKRTYWYYVYKVYDPSTKKAVPQAEVEFKEGKAIKVNYE